MSTNDEGEQPHQQLRGLLPSARAESCQVIATFIDIRGFSTFAAKSESFDSAIYLRSVYSAILDSYFPDADFFKPTGDGLLLIHELPYDAPKVPSVVTSVLARCVDLVESFGQITAEDFMVNFAVPQRMGVGVARGSVTRLVSGHLVLDYTGRCLNLAARLMDKARPYGVVFADAHAARLMEDAEVAANFTGDRVCIRGISEQEPIAISVTAGVEIMATDREPLQPSTHIWGEPTNLSVDEVRELSGYGFHLPRAPHSFEVAMVHVQRPTFDKQGRRNGSVTSFAVPGKVDIEPEGPVVRISMKRVIASLQDIPATTTSKILGITKKTWVTFTPFCMPAEDPD